MEKHKNTVGVYDAESLHPTNSVAGSASVDGSISQTPPGSRLYHVYHTMFRYDYNVTAADKTPLFHVYNSLFTPKKPDLTVHAGSDENGPAVAACKFLHFSRHFKVCIGNPDDVSSTQWEDLVCQNMWHNKFRWQMTINDGRRKSFVWKSTHSVGAGGEKPSVFNSNCWKLLDERSGRIVAVFTGKMASLKKSGQLQVDADYGQKFDLMVLVTVLALYEKQRRRNSSAAGGSGGGGGGGG
ncbi:hypothetical protein BDV59DRAFT_167769 [Aspergillus ambiguus]|uniref:uncharacterized protein n=1 Tax=Aspergillus ambiguus TaxID=176160 RepID=UPI003CCD71ED